MKSYIFEATSSSKKKAINEIVDTLDISKDLLEFQTSGDSSNNLITNIFNKEPVSVQAYIKEIQTFPIEKMVRGILLTLLKKMGLEAQIKNIINEKKRIYVELDSEEAALIIGKNGKRIETLEFIINSMIPFKYRNSHKIILNISSYRDKRELTVKKMAIKIAELVNRRGFKKKTELMSPSERKIFHITLEKDEKVSTKSEGVGLYKKINVFPIRKKSKKT